MTDKHLSMFCSSPVFLALTSNLTHDLVQRITENSALTLCKLYVSYICYMYETFIYLLYVSEKLHEINATYSLLLVMIELQYQIFSWLCSSSNIWGNLSLGIFPQENIYIVTQETLSWDINLKYSTMGQCRSYNTQQTRTKPNILSHYNENRSCEHCEFIYPFQTKQKSYLQIWIHFQ